MSTETAPLACQQQKERACIGIRSFSACSTSPLRPHSCSCSYLATSRSSMRLSLLLSLRQNEQIWHLAYASGIARAAITVLPPPCAQYYTLRTSSQHAKLDNSARVDPSKPIQGPLLERPEEPGPEDCCQVSSYASLRVHLLPSEAWLTLLDCTSEWVLFMRVGHVQRQSA